MRKIKRIFQLANSVIVDNLKAIANSKNKKFLKKNIYLKNKFKDKRLFIVMTGQSVDEIDLLELKNEYVMGVNFMMIHHQFRKADVNFYCLPGSWNTFTEDKLNWILQNVYANANPDCHIFIQSSAHNWAKENIFYNEENTYYFHTDTFIPGGNPPYCGLGRLEKGSFSFSIGAAIEMGFKEIFLIGCDYAKIPMQIGHFYSPEDEIAETPDELIYFHKQIEKYAQDNGTKIWNIVDEGYTSEVFQAMNRSQLSNLLKDQT